MFDFIISFLFSGLWGSALASEKEIKKAIIGIHLSVQSFYPSISYMYIPLIKRQATTLGSLWQRRECGAGGILSLYLEAAQPYSHEMSTSQPVMCLHTNSLLYTHRTWHFWVGFKRMAYGDNHNGNSGGLYSHTWHFSSSVWKTGSLVWGNENSCLLWLAERGPQQPLTSRRGGSK